MLNARQKKFAEYYAQSGNAEQAAVKAGYSEKYARGNAHKLVANSGIAEYIRELTEKAKDERILTAKDRWGLARNVFVDCADQATITELNKYKREHGCIYVFQNAWKKMKIIDRINLQLGWYAADQMIVLDSCVNYISEMELYSWR